MSDFDVGHLVVDFGHLGINFGPWEGSVSGNRFYSDGAKSRYSHASFFEKGGQNINVM